MAGFEAHAILLDLRVEDHEDVSTTLGHIACGLRARGKGAEALGMQQNAHDILSRTIGYDNSQEAPSLRSL